MCQLHVCMHVYVVWNSVSPFRIILLRWNATCRRWASTLTTSLSGRPGFQSTEKTFFRKPSPGVTSVGEDSTFIIRVGLLILKHSIVVNIRITRNSFLFHSYLCCKISHSLQTKFCIGFSRMLSCLIIVWHHCNWTLSRIIPKQCSLVTEELKHS